MAENKVQFNLSNVHYAVYDDSTETWDEPVKLPGAVSLSLEQQGELKKFYADGVVYYISNNNQGYSGDLEVARFPDQMLQDIWGYTLGTTSKVLTENAGVEAKTFALLYQIDGDQNNDYFVMYACTGTRPGVGGATNEDTKSPKTQTSTISAVPMSNGSVFARTTKDTPSTTKNGWFSSVFVEGA